MSLPKNIRQQNQPTEIEDNATDVPLSSAAHVHFGTEVHIMTQRTASTLLALNYSQLPNLKARSPIKPINDLNKSIPSCKASL